MKIEGKIGVKIQKINMKIKKKIKWQEKIAFFFCKKLKTNF